MALAETKGPCFCLQDDDPTLQFVMFECGHVSHRSCTRKLLRMKWSESEPKKVDGASRRIARVPCPYCRRPFTVGDLRRLQEQTKLVSVHMELRESDPDSVYGIYVTEVLPEGRGATLTDTYRTRDLPPSEKPCTRLLYADVEVVSTSPVADFEVVVQREQPELLVVRRYRVPAREATSLERDWKEEREQERIVRDLQRTSGGLRVVGEDAMEDDDEESETRVPPNSLMSEEAFDVESASSSARSSPLHSRSPSPYLPSVQELINSNYYRPASPVRVPSPRRAIMIPYPPPRPRELQEPRPGPSRLDADSRYWAASTAPPMTKQEKERSRQEQRLSKRKDLVKKRNGAYYRKLNNNLKSLKDKLNAMKKNIKRWEENWKEMRKLDVELCTRMNPSELKNEVDALSSMVDSLDRKL